MDDASPNPGEPIRPTRANFEVELEGPAPHEKTPSPVTPSRPTPRPPISGGDQYRAGGPTPEVLPPLRPHGGAAPWLLALLGWSLLICTYDLDGGALFEGTDCWVGQTAREMKERGEWLIPYFSGEVRLQKSPGPYWAVMLASYLRGGVVDEVATRIPNALSAVGLVGVIFWLAKRIAGIRAAIFAGFVALTTPLVLQWSHRGAADLGMTFFSTLSLACLWVGIADEPPGRRRNLYLLGAYFSAGLCMLYKMPMPLVTVGIPAIGSLVLQNRWKALKNPIHLLGLLLFLLPWLPWVIYIYMQQGDIALDKWRVEYIDRMTGDLPNVKANETWYFYFFYIGVAFVYAIPYLLSIPAAFGRTLKRTSGISSDGMLFMLIWFVSLFAFFTASTGKETRYFLPALPPMYVLLGIELSRFFDPDRKGSRALARLGTIAVWVIIPLAVVGGAFYMNGYEPEALPFIKKGFEGYHGTNAAFEWDELRMPYIVLGFILTIGLCASAGLFLRGSRNAAFGVLVCTVLLSYMWGWSWVAPIVQGQRANLNFAKQLKEKLDPKYHDHMYQIAQQNPTIIWHSDVRFPRIVDQLDLLKMQDGERDLQREMSIVLQEIIKKLNGDELALIVLPREYWDLKHHLLRPGEMPETHLWMQSEIGPIKHQTLMFGNQPPPWPEPTLREPEAHLEVTRPGTNEPLDPETD